MRLGSNKQEGIAIEQDNKLQVLMSGTDIWLESNRKSIPPGSPGGS